MADQERVPLKMLSNPRTRASLLVGAAFLVPGCFAPDLMPAGSGETDAGSSGNPTTGPTTGFPGTGSTGSATTTGMPSTGVETQTSGEPTTGDTTGDQTTTGDPATGDGTTTSGGEDETGSSSTGEPVMCGDGGVCIPAVPEGWNGPVATRTLDIEEDIPPCGGDAYTDLQVSDAFGGLSADDYECDCECGAGAGVLGCEGTATIELSSYPPMEGFSPCSNPTYVYNETIPSAAPQSVSIPMDDIRGIILDGDPTSQLVGSCNPDATVTPTPAGFATTTIACGTFEVDSEGCGDGVCVPQPAAPYDAPVCVWAEGDLECPAGFGDRTVYHSGYTDDRDCSSCSCGSPEGDCDGERVSLRGWCEEASPCFEGPFTPPGTCGPGGTWACERTARFYVDEIGFCEELGPFDFCNAFLDPNCDENHAVTELRDLSYDAGVATGSCTPSGGNPTGTVDGVEATTLCCSGG